MIDDLVQLGDRLEAAIARDISGQGNKSAEARHVLVIASTSKEDAPMTIDHLTDHAAPPVSETKRRSTSRRARRIAVASGVAVVALAGGVAAAAYNMSSDEVSRGLPGGSLLFEGTNPSCTTSDGVVFECTLASSPTAEVLDNYQGAAELFVDSTLHIAGGCRGQSEDGLTWRCYLGKRAVEEGILTADLLGEYSPSPGRG
jgi:hypothetical protein